jgi:hypothetical protein
MKNYSHIIFVFVANICSAQAVSDEFNNDLSLWSGTQSHFIINTSHQLQLNNTAAATSYLVTTFAPSVPNLEWNVYVRQAFAGSANNYGRIYLLSAQASLTQPTNGYYLQLGEGGSNDAVELFRQDGGTSVSVCRAANASIASAFAIRIKVLRDENAVWKLLIDYNAGNDFIEAASGTDATYTTGGWMGFVCVYTAGNATRFYYDDVYAGPVKPDIPPPDIAEKNDVVINEFFPDPSPPVGLPEQEFVEIYNRSSKTFDLNGWKIGDATSSVTMTSVVIHPDEYVVINSLPSLNNGGDVIKIIDNKNVVIDSIAYTLDWYQDASKSGGGYTIERLNPEVASMDVTNWYVSQDASGGTPGRRNSVFGRNPDSMAPIIIDVRYLVDSILIKFSEPVIPVGIIDGFRAEFRFDTTAVVYLEGLTNGLPYTLRITGLTDLAGNVASSVEFPFTYFIPHPISRKDVILTEVMSDPSPVVQLPEAEYVELHNRSMHPVDLSGWHLEDHTTIGKLPPKILMPGSYVLLTSTANTSKFQNANVVPVTSFPSLGNLGDMLVLREPGGSAIDSVVYELSWYRSFEKSDGGWSLELIDVNNPCGESDNWVASEDIDGGTPGFVNSVFGNKPDVTAPKLLSVIAVSPDSLILTFDERPKDAGSYSLPGKPYIVGKSIVFLLTDKLQLKTLYSITVTNVSDCNGNRMTTSTLDFFLPERAEPRDIIINEILFNPRPGKSDFVELYNRSDKYINLKNWRLSDKVITTDNAILIPGAYEVLSDSNMSMPSMPDDKGAIILTNNDSVVIDQFTYNDDMHSPILADTEGVSLERLSPDGDDWHSANGSAGYATPGRLNSNSRPAPATDDNTIGVLPEVIHPSGVLPFSQISYRFDRGGMVANVSVIDIEGRVIKTIASNETLAAEGSFQWDGDRNEGGLARAGYYMIWFQVFDLGGDVRTFRRRIVVGF